MKIKCPCGKFKIIKKTNNVGEIVKSTGFTYVMTYGMEKTYFICPECNKKLKKLLNEILKIIPDKNIYIRNLIEEGE